MLARSVLAACALCTACFEQVAKQEPGPYCPAGEDLAAYVDPLIGTAGQGNALPGALVPHGMVRVGPDTVNDLGKVEAYDYGSDRIEGFTHTNWQGPGGSGNGYSHVLLLPVWGAPGTDIAAWAPRFSHHSEEASPGYYAVTLEGSKIRVELTATGHAAFHRYHYDSAHGPASVLVDLGHSLGDSKGGWVEIVGDRTVRGCGEYNVHPLLDLILNFDGGRTGETTVCFHAEFSQPFVGRATWVRDRDQAVFDEGSISAEGRWLGARLDFDARLDPVLDVRVGISLIDEDQAQANLEAEIGEQGFGEVHAAARAAWNCRLNRIQVEGGSEDQRTLFYTSLYRTLMQPADHTEAGGRFYSAADEVGAVFELEPGRRFYTDDWCAWDTFRTSRPLATLVEPETVDDVIASYLHLYEQGGWLPKCTWQAGGYSRVMIGNHAVSMVADAAVKGFDGFDAATAWEALYKSATTDNTQDSYGSLCGYLNLGTPPEYIEKGYVSHECDGTQAASMTLEYAYNDWCIGRAAPRLGATTEQSQAFESRSGYWRNHWNPDSGFMQGRHEDGSWVEPFDPAGGGDANDFCEATSWIYSWFVPHDVPGLIDAMGGEQPFVDKLDRFFDEGHFDVSNEPSFHIPFLYNLAGAPEKTQARVRRVLNEDFSAGSGGLPGNDDAGATSAWYVLAAMGLYPLAPGDGVYQLSSPLFERITLHLEPGRYRGRTFVIEATGNGPQSPYIRSAALDGESLGRSEISHARIVRGGTLVLEMGASPD